MNGELFDIGIDVEGIRHRIMSTEQKLVKSDLNPAHSLHDFFITFFTCQIIMMTAKKKNKSIGYLMETITMSTLKQRMIIQVKISMMK